MSICSPDPDCSSKTERVCLALAAMVHEGYLLLGLDLCSQGQAETLQAKANYSLVLCVGNQPFEVPLQEHYLCA